MSRRRDTRRRHVYAAQWRAIEPFIGTEPQLKRGECRDLVRAHQREEPIKIFFRRKGQMTAWGGRTDAGTLRVSLPPWARTVPVLLHEIAHCLIPPDAPWHGEEWRAEFIALLWIHRPEIAKRMETEFAADGLGWVGMFA